MNQQGKTVVVMSSFQRLILLHVISLE